MFLKVRSFHRHLISVECLKARGRFVEQLSLTSVAQQSVTKIISVKIMNLVTPKAGAKHEVLVNELATDQSVLFCLVSSVSGRSKNIDR